MHEASRTQHAKKIVFLIPLTTCILLIASKSILENPPFSNPKFSGGNTGKLRVIFLHTNDALEVQNRVQFAWPKCLVAVGINFWWLVAVDSACC